LSLILFAPVEYRRDLCAIHNASIRVLENTGIKAMSNKALDILGKAGEKVDCERNHTSVSGNLVEEALKRDPKTIRYVDRSPKYDFMLNKHLDWQKWKLLDYNWSCDFS